MSELYIPVADPELDLVLERYVDVPPERVWSAWTDAEQLKHWFVPRPWTLEECELDLRPGGVFRTVMRSPEGQDFPGTGCFLVVDEPNLLVWTDTLGPGFRPAEEPFFTAIVMMEPHGSGTKYTARAVHGSLDTRKKHEEMGFHDGWGTVFEQMLEHLGAKGGRL